jgi:Tol biopolymer transport system component
MKPDRTALANFTDGHGDDREPRFSPGKSVAFASDRAFTGNYDVWVADAATGKLKQWTLERTDEFEPACSPDRSETAFVSGTGAVGTTIRSVNRSGQPRHLLTAPEGAHVNSPSWSPDGNQIAYSQTTGNKTRLMVAGKPVGEADDVFPFPARWLSADRLLYTCA